ncbi:response regulator transcription factor [Nocardioides fonticola]|uniref:Response regulator transcription factor n=1 Tax=Nocardioides fonticola TaxID=450363 RepID=A0ABP7XAF7_9ACTN
MLTVGICEDDPTLRRIVVGTLELAGHRVVATRDGAEALRALGGEAALDVVVLDIGLPDVDGRDLCQALRSGGQHAPVLFLTALGAVHDRLSGFAAGGDDYLPKPFDLKELTARVEALGRRSRAVAADPEAGLVLDPVRHAIVHGDRSVLLTPTEFRMLAAITSRPGEVVRRRAVVAAAWPDGAAVSENTVDSYMRRLRAKLEEVEAPVRLHTVRGVGFELR